MKKQLFSLFAALVLSSTLSAQTSEGHVKYSIDMTSDNPEMAMAISMMQGSTLQIYFKEQQSRVEMAMGSFMNTITISDATKGEALTLTSGMMGNSAMKTTFGDDNGDGVSDVDAEVDIDITITEETKKILDYTCKKAIMSDEEGNESIFWFTDQINANKQGQNMLSDKIPGFPLQMEVNTNGMVMVMTATEFNKKLKDKNLFDMTVPEGYTLTTPEELIDSMQE
jgi:GLPGLI family protein